MKIHPAATRLPAYPVLAALAVATALVACDRERDGAPQSTEEKARPLQRTAGVMTIRSDDPSASDARRRQEKQAAPASKSKP